MTVELEEREIDIRAVGGLPEALEKATGITRDMGTSGAYFWISGEHSVGKTISFSIAIKTDFGPMVWVCQGDVVHTEQRGPDTGAAVKITRTAVEPISRW